MIMTKLNEQYICNGITYRIGGEVTVIDGGAYAGLIGTITEIRDGADKETDNDAADIYCDFDLSEIPCDRKRLIEKFSELYGKPMELADINLEQVIMAPEMIMPLDEVPADTKIYVVSEDWNGDCGTGVDLFIYTDAVKAAAKMRQLVRDDKRGGCMADWKDEDDFREESGEQYYSAWLNNDSDGYHYNVCLEEHEVDISALH